MLKSSPRGNGVKAKGRRPGETRTREAIVEAARASFAEAGYEGVSIREIARRAKVDPALVMHFFGSKDGVFRVAMELPFDAAQAIEPVLAGPRSRLGERIVRLFLELWEDDQTRRQMLGLVRSAASNDAAAERMRELVGREIFGRFAAVARTDHADLRAQLIGSQLVGLGFNRYVLRFEPIASAGVDEIAAALGPTIQRYLTADLRLP
jgi:AcrR family transcriptional regulator